MVPNWSPNGPWGILTSNLSCRFFCDFISFKEFMKIMTDGFSSVIWNDGCRVSITTEPSSLQLSPCMLDGHVKHDEKFSTMLHASQIVGNKMIFILTCDFTMLLDCPMTMVPTELTWIRAYSKELWAYDLFNHLADLNHWWTSVVTCTLHAVICDLLLIYFNWSSVFSCVFTHSGLCTDIPNYFAVSDGFILAPWLNIQV